MEIGPETTRLRSQGWFDLDKQSTPFSFYCLMVTIMYKPAWSLSNYLITLKRKEDILIGVTDLNEYRSGEEVFVVKPSRQSEFWLF